jgi:hypothetical protein
VLGLPYKQKFFEDWVSAGKPSYAKYARKTGTTPERVRRLVIEGARSLLRMKDHPLHIEAVELQKRKRGER